MTKPVTLSDGQKEVVQGIWSHFELQQKLDGAFDPLAFAAEILGMAYQDTDSQLDPNEDRSVMLWAEIHKLRARAAGPEGTGTWYDAAVDERRQRVALQKKLDALQMESLPETLCKCEVPPGIGVPHEVNCPITVLVRAAFKKSGESASGQETDSTLPLSTARIKKLMQDIGLPNSRSAYVVFSALDREVRYEYHSAWNVPTQKTLDLVNVHLAKQGKEAKDWNMDLIRLIKSSSVWKRKTDGLEVEVVMESSDYGLEECAPVRDSRVLFIARQKEFKFLWSQRTLDFIEAFEPVKMGTGDAPWTVLCTHMAGGDVPEGTWEYEVTEHPRKGGGEYFPPEGEGWVRDYGRGRPGEAWDRFDNHEEVYWKRRVIQAKPVKESLAINEAPAPVTQDLIDAKKLVSRELAKLLAETQLTRHDTVYDDRDRGYNKAVGHLSEKIRERLAQWQASNDSDEVFYRFKSPVVQARQWDGTASGAEAINQWLGVKSWFRISTPEEAKVQPSVIILGSNNYVATNGWVIRQPSPTGFGFGVAGMDDAAFRQNYEEVLP